MAWHDHAVLDRAAAMHIGRELDHPRIAFGTEVTLPASATMAHPNATSAPDGRYAGPRTCGTAR
jgi:hypothetical protein